jgi:hypothetical protein
MPDDFPVHQFLILLLDSCLVLSNCFGQTSMPITIYRDDTPENQDIACLCNENWDLSGQIEALMVWLENDGSDLPVGSYIVDIGFRWRRDANGGGAVLSPSTMKRMSDIGISLFLSEYSGFTGS